MYQAGDILFYAATNGAIEDKVISDVTSSRFVHVAIALDENRIIEALNNGVSIDDINIRPIAACYSFVGENQDYDRCMLLSALTWLENMNGKAYGYDDIANALLVRLHLNFAITDNKFDCSALASEFLLRANGEIPNHPEISNPHVVTPATLAEMLNVK